MIKTILKINLFIVALALQGCAYEYCCAEEIGYYLNTEGQQSLYEIGDCYRFRVSCEVMCGGDCYGGPTD